MARFIIIVTCDMLLACLDFGSCSSSVRKKCSDGLRLVCCCIQVVQNNLIHKFISTNKSKPKLKSEVLISIGCILNYHFLFSFYFGYNLIEQNNNNKMSSRKTGLVDFSKHVSKMTHDQWRRSVGAAVCVEGLGKGFLEYFGPTKKGGPNELGIRLRDGRGDCDGTKNGTRYFTTEESYGVFVAPPKVMLLEHWNTAMLALEKQRKKKSSSSSGSGTKKTTAVVAAPSNTGQPHQQQRPVIIPKRRSPTPTDSIHNNSSTTASTTATFRREVGRTSPVDMMCPAPQKRPHPFLSKAGKHRNSSHNSGGRARSSSFSVMEIPQHVKEAAKARRRSSDDIDLRPTDNNNNMSVAFSTTRQAVLGTPDVAPIREEEHDHDNDHDSGSSDNGGDHDYDLELMQDGRASVESNEGSEASCSTVSTTASTATTETNSSTRSKGKKHKRNSSWRSAMQEEQARKKREEVKMRVALEKAALEREVAEEKNAIIKETIGAQAKAVEQLEEKWAEEDAKRKSQRTASGTSEPIAAVSTTEQTTEEDPEWLAKEAEWKKKQELMSDQLSEAEQKLAAVKLATRQRLELYLPSPEPVKMGGGGMLRLLSPPPSTPAELKTPVKSSSNSSSSSDDPWDGKLVDIQERLRSIAEQASMAVGEYKSEHPDFVPVLIKTALEQQPAFLAKTAAVVESYSADTITTDTTTLGSSETNRLLATTSTPTREATNTTVPFQSHMIMQADASTDAIENRSPTRRPRPLSIISEDESLPPTPVLGSPATPRSDLLASAFSSNRSSYINITSPIKYTSSSSSSGSGNVPPSMALNPPASIIRAGILVDDDDAVVE